MKYVIVLSGGLDSSTALAWAKNDTRSEVVGAISFWYGSKHNDAEWAAAQRVAAYYKVPIKRVRLDFIAENFSSDLLKSGGKIPEGHYADPSMKKTVVPFRNGIMLSIAAGYAESIGADAVVLGNHYGDHAIYPDCRAEFVDAMSQAIATGTYANIKLVSPFCKMSKTDIVKLASIIDAPLQLTYSCYNGGEKHCGRCGTCFERKEAFAEAGKMDLTEYET